MNKPLTLLLAGVLTLATPAALAWRTVFDPSNYTQNVMTAARTLEQINNQIQQLQNEAQMLMNQGKNLARLDFDSTHRLHANLSTTMRLVDQARGLAFDVSRLDGEFARLYPDQYGAAVDPPHHALADRGVERGDALGVRLGGHAEQARFALLPISWRLIGRCRWRAGCPGAPWRRPSPARSSGRRSR